MNERINHPGHDAGDAALRLALRGLRKDHDPGHDLWAGIDARIHALPQASAPVSPPRRWAWPLAMAASMLLSAGVAWQMRPAEAPVAAQATDVRVAATLVQREASTLTASIKSRPSASRRKVSASPLA